MTPREHVQAAVLAHQAASSHDRAHKAAEATMANLDHVTIGVHQPNPAWLEGDELPTAPPPVRFSVWTARDDRELYVNVEGSDTESSMREALAKHVVARLHPEQDENVDDLGDEDED